MATGWLGWPPADAWHTPIPQITCALKAKIEWTKMTNPFGAPPKKEKTKAEVSQELLAKLRMAAAGKPSGSE